MKRAFSIFLAVLLSAAGAHADSEPKEEKRTQQCSALLAPTSVSLRDTGFDQTRFACGADSLSIGTRAYAFVDTPNFYGTLSGALFLDWTTFHKTGYELGVGARIADFRFVQSAVFTATETSVGPIYVSIARPRARRMWGRPFVLSHKLRLEVPLSASSQENLTFTASPSINATLSATSSLDIHSRLAVLLWSVLPDSGADGRVAVLSSLDLGYSPISVISLLAGVEGQAGWYGLGLDHLQARSGLRIKTGSESAIELSGGYVLAGNEGSALVLWLGFRTSHSPIAKKKRSRLLDWAR